MVRKGTFTGLVSVSALVIAASVVPAAAQSANGTWLRSNGAHIAVFNCGGGLGMKVVKSPEAAKRGKTIMCGAKKTGPGKWKGTVLNLDDGQKYSGYVTLSGKSLTLSGCVLGGMICKNDTWKRLR